MHRRNVYWVGRPLVPKGVSSDRVLGWVDFSLMFHCQPNYASADGNLAEVAG